MTTQIPDDVRTLLDSCPVGVLGTSKSDGSPRLATVVFVLDGDRVLISSEVTAGKVRDVRRTGEAALCVHGLAPPYPSLALHGPARLLVDGLGRASTLVWKKLHGEHVAEPFKDEDVAAFGRTIIEINVKSIAGRAHI
jgi:nitroimidazol reductase NimA-like FMN-containing flavoprotein (pyridoxamine 5'-phosphate oxidase superfamily)